MPVLNPSCEFLLKVTEAEKPIVANANSINWDGFTALWVLIGLMNKDNEGNEADTDGRNSQYLFRIPFEFDLHRSYTIVMVKQGSKNSVFLRCN